MTFREWWTANAGLYRYDAAGAAEAAWHAGAAVALEAHSLDVLADELERRFREEQDLSPPALAALRGEVESLRAEANRIRKGVVPG